MPTNATPGASDDGTGTTRCDGCGVVTRNLNAQEHCLNCQRVSIETDSYTAEAVLDLLEATLRTALEQAYVHPDDVLARVGLVIREQETRAETIFDLSHANRRNMDARMRDNGMAA